jgi:putative nucleotidyltransferase with HDIG domain
MLALTNRARLFIIADVCAAAALSYFSLSHWSSSGIWTFLTMFCLCAVTGTMKVVVPRLQGSLSMSYVFCMLGVVQMSAGETLLMGFAATLVQSYWRAKKKPNAIQLIFNLAVICLSISSAQGVFHAAPLIAWVPSQFVRIFFAVFAYFTVNTLSVSIVIGLTERVSVWSVWRNSYLWSFPHYLVSASLVGAFLFVRSRVGIEVAVLLLPVAYVLFQTFGMHFNKLTQALERAEQDKRHAEETSNLHLRTIRALALAIEAKDQTTGEHLHRVQVYAIEIAKDLGLPEEQMQPLRAAAILHDVGKLAVPEHIISKPGKLTPQEFAKMKTHTVVGAEIVASVNFPFAVAPLVRSHHEKWDGSGYPDGLKGEEIPIGARILSAVDCLDALASDRSYRKAMPLDKAMAIVVAESGKAFDPVVVEALRLRCHELEQMARATLEQDLVKLSTDAVVDRGIAPDAGYAAGSLTIEERGDVEQAEAQQELSTVDFINSLIGKGESMEADLACVEQQLHRLIPFDCFAVYSRRGEKVECVFAEGKCASFFTGLAVSSGVGVSGWTVANRTPLMNGGAMSEFGIVSQVPPEFTLSSGLSVPLESEFGTIGALTLYSQQRDGFQSRHLRALLAIASRIAYQLSVDSPRHARRSKLSIKESAIMQNQLRQLSNGLQDSPEAFGFNPLLLGVPDAMTTSNDVAVY